MGIVQPIQDFIKFFDRFRPKLLKFGYNIKNKKHI